MNFAYNVIKFTRPDLDFFAMLPVVALGALMVLAMVLELNSESENQGTAGTWLCSAGLLALSGYLLSVSPGLVRFTFNEMLVDDTLSRGGALIIVAAALFAILSGQDELARAKSKFVGEFNALIMAASLGMVLMISSANTMLMFLGLELFSIALYLLCIFFPERSGSRESGVKYFLLSSGASAVLLYGLALLYGATGTTWLSGMAVVGTTASSKGLLIAGSVFVLSGLLFKLAVVPFHFWAPDVYQGAPTSVTAYMSVATKVAALLALWRVFILSSNTIGDVASLVLASIAGVTILLGNLLALPQTSVKRMLAYSGVANAGYLLIAPVVGPGLETPMLFFLATYLFGNMGAFIALLLVEAKLGREATREDLRGLFVTRPWLAVSFGMCLVSLAGLPPAGGFLGKFFLFGRAIAAGKLILPALAIVGSLLGCAYYLGTAISMFDRKLVGKANPTGLSQEDDVQEQVSPAAVALAICTGGVLLLGIYPNGLMYWLSLGLPVY